MDTQYTNEVPPEMLTEWGISVGIISMPLNAGDVNIRKAVTPRGHRLSAAGV